MPAIFSEEDRAALTVAMIDAGWDALLRDGYRGLRIEDVARSVGVAKGTFYSFFASKDAFVLAMVAQNRRRLRDSYIKLCAAHPKGINADTLLDWLIEQWSGDRVLFRCVSIDDYRRLRAALPQQELLGPEIDEDFMLTVADNVRHPRAGARIEVASNLMRTAGLLLMQPVAFSTDALDATLTALMEAVVRELCTDEPHRRDRGDASVSRAATTRVRDMAATTEARDTVELIAQV